jgi:hypothetical protein
MENYKIELEHIRIELIHRRTKNINVINHLRHFVDNGSAINMDILQMGIEQLGVR